MKTLANIKDDGINFIMTKSHKNNTVLSSLFRSQLLLLWIIHVIFLYPNVVYWPIFILVILFLQLLCVMVSMDKGNM